MMEPLTTVQIIEEAIESGDVLTVRKLVSDLKEAAEAAVTHLMLASGVEHERDIRDSVYFEVDRILVGFKLLDMISVGLDGVDIVTTMPLEYALEIAKKDEEITSQPADIEV